MKWQTVSLGLALFGVLGCGSAHDDSTLASPSTSTNALTADCDLNGTWAMKFEIPVRWPATLAVETGDPLDRLLAEVAALPGVDRDQGQAAALVGKAS